MNDHSTDIQPLLPAFAEHETGALESERVRTHVASCDACRAALDSFTVLERSLLARRNEIPPVDAFLPSFRSAPAVLRRSPLVRVFRSAMSVPGVSILLVLWVGMLTWNFRAVIGKALSLSTPDTMSGGFEVLANALVVLTQGNVWLLIGLCIAAAIAVAGSMGAMTLRYVRH
jgi:predicted anti-sigma-YlaC factor YlaD